MCVCPTEQHTCLYAKHPGSISIFFCLLGRGGLGIEMSGCVLQCADTQTHTHTHTPNQHIIKDSVHVVSEFGSWL